MKPLNRSHDAESKSYLFRIGIRILLGWPWLTLETLPLQSRSRVLSLEPETRKRLGFVLVPWQQRGKPFNTLEV